MFAWLGKRFPTPWNRRTRWTPLLQSQREFQRTLSKERSRADREDGLFGFIILRLLDLHGAKSQTKQLARLLHRRLRQTDEKGHLGPGRIGILLPSTPNKATQAVLDDILQLARLHRLCIEGEAFVYPDRNPTGGRPTDSSIAEQVGITDSDVADSGEREEVEIFNPSVMAVMLPEYPRWKRAIDVAVASIGIILALPLLVMCALLVKLSGPGQVIFSQRRTGYLGVPFTMYKFRSMVSDAEELKASLLQLNERDGPAFKMSDDPRTTMIGRFMRAIGLDELPQLFNVLRGDMALVGPRPLPVHEANQCLPWQKRRIEAKPGLTCFWQVDKSRDVAFEDWMRMDLKYARNTSPFLDLQLLVRTVSAVFLGRVGH